MPSSPSEYTITLLFDNRPDPAIIQSSMRSVPGMFTAAFSADSGEARIAVDPRRFDANTLIESIRPAGTRVSTRQLNLPIRGMTCLACASRIEFALEEIPGVLNASANLSDNTAVVEFIAGMAEALEFDRAVQACGYQVASAAGPVPSAQKLRPAERRSLVFAHALLFVLGFSAIFIIGWGGAATLLGQVFKSYKDVIAQVGGAVVILFGLSTLGWVRIPWLSFDTRPDWRGSGDNGWASSALMGVVFAAGWTPCIGTTLGAILTLGMSADNSAQAMVLSSGYALGMGIPFLLIGLGMEKAVGLLQRFRRHLRTVQIGSGLLLIVIGVMLLTNRLALIAIWAQRNGFFPDFPLGEAATPTYAIALAAGLISFLSPCVLPLVPAYIGYLSGHALAGKTS